MYALRNRRLWNSSRATRWLFIDLGALQVLTLFSLTTWTIGNVYSFSVNWSCVLQACVFGPFCRQVAVACTRRCIVYARMSRTEAERRSPCGHRHQLRAVSAADVGDDEMRTSWYLSWSRQSATLRDHYASHSMTTVYAVNAAIRQTPRTGPLHTSYIHIYSPFR